MDVPYTYTPTHYLAHISLQYIVISIMHFRLQNPLQSVCGTSSAVNLDQRPRSFVRVSPILLSDKNTQK